MNEDTETQVRLLGPVDIVLGGIDQQVSGLRRKALLAVLALHHRQVVATDQLVDIVWGEAAGSVSVNTVQRHISYLRALLGGRRAVVARPPGYLLALPPGAVDAGLADELVDQAGRADAPADRARLAERARRLWRGEPLGGVTDIAWLGDAAQRLSGLFLRATHILMDARLALGEHAGVLPELDRLAAGNPLDERLQSQLILALYRSGRQADALDRYRRLRHTLAEELGILPSGELRELETAILRQDPALAPPRPAVAVRPAPSAPQPPRPGLVRLTGTPVVGRAGELATVRAAVESVARGHGGAIFVLGEPGIGKSRLATEAAGLAERAGLTVLRGRSATPEAQFRALAEALQSVLRRAGAPAGPELGPYRPALSVLVPEWRDERGPASDTSLVVLAEAVLRLLATVGRPHGCVLIVEDLHDADADTLTVLDYLIDNLGRERLLVIGTSRATPGAALNLIRTAQHRRVATVADLGRLGDDQVRDLAANCLGVDANEVPGPVIERLLATADGVPLHVEELLAAMAGDGVLAWTGTGWAVTGPVPAGVPASLRTTLVGRTDRLGPAAAGLLRAAALFGRRFPAVAAGAAAGLSGPDLIAGLREVVDSQLVVPEDDPQWYAFRHVLTAESLLAVSLPLERAALARRAAQALESPPVPHFDGTDQLAGTLWSIAGEPVLAAERFARAGRRAIGQGAVSTAVTLLERAAGLLAGDCTGDTALEVREALIDAYAIAGRVADAYPIGDRLDERAAPHRRARLHLRLAHVAVAAGHWERGSRELSAARRAAGDAPDPGLTARMDEVQAQLAFGDPATPDRLATTVALAGRALRGAQAAGLPEVSCGALKTLGRCARLRDLAEADDLYERALAIATEHHLLTWRITLLYNLGAGHGIRHADDSRLREALTLATEAGAVATALDIRLELSILRLCRGEFEAADADARHCEETAGRLRLTLTQQIAVGVRAIVAGHRARRADLAALLARFAGLGAADDDFSSATHGLGTAFCHLLHEQHGPALAELDEASAREARQPTPYLSLIHGPHLLMSVRAGRAGAAECAAFAGSAQQQAAWNRQFLVLAEAFVHGRAGRADDATRAVARFLAVSAPYPLARHLGLRLVAQEALDGGWGDPVAWLRTADTYFHDAAPHVARACRDLMRKAGAPVPQHRQGSAALPARLRRHGVTVREYEVLDLVVAGMTNQQIGDQLYLSSRTVEKHVASLLAKTGAERRGALAAFTRESG
ncbi:BTAD domain-containing putative transcriptional regulator [Actinoplanes sp. L3-i22]|uniref:BTAD domain-containing putative transcriptional regulator n=1 Tax=Actinoplanes sp. L3-i22 TaxID=2836373 RepID=UPI001C77484D|nr:BTAD domain-containing putative transcriptional regulator [Actinoplanes sp. L3-i22]BCY11714.1 SARP family transcriptional regulator [Actinoplanes sp. L3-i22]